MINKKLQSLIDRKKRENRQKFSQVQIAKLLGMSKQNFGTFLNHGYPQLSMERQRMLCDYLGVRVSDYFKET